MMKEESVFNCIFKKFSVPFVLFADYKQFRQINLTRTEFGTKRQFNHSYPPKIKLFIYQLDCNTIIFENQDA